MSKPWMRIGYLFVAAFLVAVRRGFHEGDFFAVVRPLRDDSADQIYALAAEWLMWLAFIWVASGVVPRVFPHSSQHKDE